MSDAVFGTMDEWIEALEEMTQSGEAEDGFYTRAALAEHFNFGKDKMLRMLKGLAAEGRLEVRTRVEVNLAGRRQSYPVYRLAPAPKKPRRKK